MVAFFFIPPPPTGRVKKKKLALEYDSTPASAAGVTTSMYAGTTQKHPGLALIGRAYKAAISKSGSAHLAAVPHPQPNLPAPLLEIGACYL